MNNVYQLRRLNAKCALKCPAEGDDFKGIKHLAMFQSIFLSFKGASFCVAFTKQEFIAWHSFVINLDRLAVFFIVFAKAGPKEIDLDLARIESCTKLTPLTKLPRVPTAFVYKEN